jgi:hypothetical protein
MALQFSTNKIVLAASSFVLAGLLAIAFTGGCKSGSAAYPDRLTFFLTGDSRGYLEPCGCRRDQAGGLPGRATLMRAAPAANRVILDAGNLTPGGRPYEQMKTHYLMDGMSKIGYDAVNLGKTEAGLDLNTLRQMIAQSHLPFVSANVVAKRDGAPIVETSRIVTRGRLRIGVTGVTALDPIDCGPGVDVKPPLEALSSVINTLKGSSDYIVVLAFVDESTQRQIAAHFPEVNCILGGDVPQSSNTTQDANRAFLFNVTDRGKVMGEIDLKRKGNGYYAESSRGIKIMGDQVAKDTAMLALIARYKDELRDRRYELASAEGMERISGAASTADEFVGGTACISCHHDAHKVYEASGHAHAYTTLVKKNSQYDPECLSCHTVGYGLYSGFVDAQRTPQFENIQCESCHGRGKEHINTMQAAAATGSKVHKPSTLRPVTPATCIRCHDQENSENFHYATFWPKIAH